MNYRAYRNPARAAANDIRSVPASASSNANARKHGDPVLGIVALGALLFILAWVVTGHDFLAIVALLIALVYIRVAGTFKLSEGLVPAEAEPQKRAAIRHALATDARFHGLAAAGIAGTPDGHMPWNASGKGPSTRARRRSVYDGSH
jgi:hypothetical protein